MNRLLLALSLGFTAPAALAQNCFDGDFGRGTYALPIPSDPLLVNAQFASQGVSFGNTPLGLVASYAVNFTIGFGY